MKTITKRKTQNKAAVNNHPAKKGRAFLTESDFELARQNGIETLYATFQNAGVKIPVSIALRIGVSMDHRKHLLSISKTTTMMVYATGYNSCAVDEIYSALQAKGYVQPGTDFQLSVPRFVLSKPLLKKVS